MDNFVRKFFWKDGMHDR